MERKKLDKGAILQLPLAHNLDYNTDGWRAVKCPRCGRECFERPWYFKVFRLARCEATMCSECAELIGGETGDEESGSDVQL